MNKTSVDGVTSTTLIQFIHPLKSNTSIPVLGTIVAAVTDIKWWNAATQMATFRFDSLFPPGTSWVLVQYFLFVPLAAAFMITLTLAVFRGTPSS